MRSLYIYIIAFFVVLAIFIAPKNAYANDYRFEHSNCVFSFVFPVAPSVAPIWKGDYDGHEAFIDKLPLTQKPEIQGVRVEYRAYNMETSDSLSIRTYCMTLKMPYEDNVLLAEDMINILRNAIGGLDRMEVRSALSQEEIGFSKQENGIRWMSLRGEVQQVIDNEMKTMMHYREVFTYKDQALLVVVSFSDSDENNYKDIVSALLRSLILAD